jgi:hypothetical protein
VPRGWGLSLSEAVRPAEGKEYVTRIVAAVYAAFLDIDEPVFKTGVEEQLIPGVDGEGKARAAGDADIEVFDAGGNVGIGGEILGW